MKPKVDVGPELALAIRHVKRAAEAIVGLNVGLILGAKQLRGHMSGTLTLPLKNVLRS